MFLANQPDRATADQGQPMRRIGRPRIDAVDSELFNVRVTLASAPSAGWPEVFFQFETGVDRSTSMIGNPCLVGEAVSLCGIREKDVESWFRLIDAKIAGTNDQHMTRTPSLLAAVREREAAGAHRQRNAQARADQIAQRWEEPDT